MRAYEIMSEQQLAEINWRKLAATGAMAGAAALGAVNPAQARVSIGPDGQPTQSFAQHISQQGSQQSVEPSSGSIERTPDVNVNRQDQTLEYNGKTYNMVKIGKDGPQPRIARFDAKITVPLASLGFRSIGVAPATLVGDTAYVYMP